MSSPVITKSLGRRFGDTDVVSDLDLEVSASTIQGFIGPSGSGKTTTVRMLTGVLEPTSGTVEVFGTDPQKLDTAQRSRIGYMPQLGVLYPHLTITQNLRFVADLYAVAKPRLRIGSLLDMLGLGDAADRVLSQASGGMQRRVALAAALMHEPDVLFLDEPTAGLDPLLRQDVWSHLADLRDEGRTIFVTTQIVSEAAMCDQVGLLGGGGLLAIGPPADLRRQAFGGDVVEVRATALIATTALEAIAMHDLVIDVQRHGEDGRQLRVVVADADRDAAGLRAALEEQGVDVELVERAVQPFDDVFVALIENDR